MEHIIGWKDGKPITVEGQTDHHDFGVKDDKGREIGANIYTWEQDFTETTVGWDYSCDPGHYFGFRPSATRAGKDFGPIQGKQFFTTPEARQQAITKYLAGAKRRAAKLTGE